jgi:ATP adenylyltransferase
MAFIDAPRPAGCFLCEAARAEPKEDPDHLVVAREAQAFAILNRYPYNSGHLMVAPYLHTGDLARLPAEVAAAVTALSQRALRVLQAVLTPEGYNLGFNLGRVAGAGVVDHLHQHVVPRWNGDTNYMPVLAEVKVLPEHLQATYAKVRAGFDRIP